MDVVESRAADADAEKGAAARKDTSGRAAPAHEHGERDYRPISDYGLIGDGHSAALVAKDGSIDFLCWPEFDSPALFSALLDKRLGGRFGLSAGKGARLAMRRYLPGTAILQTTLASDDGVLRVTDAMIIGDSEDVVPMRLIVRRVEALDGAPELVVHYAPRPDYARARRRLQQRGRLGWFVEAGYGVLWLGSDVELQHERDGGKLTARVRMKKGDRYRFALGFSEFDPIAVLPLDHCDDLLDETEEFWRNWTARMNYDGPFPEAVHRSLVTLKLLTFAPSGAQVAAATTSLPEAMGGKLNWDYRYCWLRDASLVLRAFMDTGYMEEGRQFLDWMLHTTRLTAPHLKPLYDLYGRLQMHEKELPHFEGYRGSSPVRIGNGASKQLQLGVYGMVVLSAFDYVERGGKLDNPAKKFLEGFARVVREDWKKPDNGIWEERGERKRHTHSALMCWSAADRLAQLAERGVINIDPEACRKVASEIAEAIETEGFKERIGAYSGLMDGEKLDAALLLMAHTHYQPPDHSRLERTHARLRAELGRGPLILRQGDPDNPNFKNESCFTVCSFWEIEYLARAKRLEEAEAMFRGVLGYANDLILFSEEADAEAGTMLGNIPQAFTHAGLVNAALQLGRAQKEAAAR